MLSNPKVLFFIYLKYLIEQNWVSLPANLPRISWTPLIIDFLWATELTRLLSNSSNDLNITKGLITQIYNYFYLEKEAGVLI